MGSVTSPLLRKEGQLVRAEVSENLCEIATLLGLVLGGSVLLIPAGDSATGGSCCINRCRACRGLGQPGRERFPAVDWTGPTRGWRQPPEALRLIPSKTIEQLQRDAAVALGGTMDAAAEAPSEIPRRSAGRPQPPPACGSDWSAIKDLTMADPSGACRWMWLSIIVVLMAAKLNAEIEYFG